MNCIYPGRMQDAWECSFLVEGIVSNNFDCNIDHKICMLETGPAASRHA